jgi:RNA polymerase sigma-54 factor
MAGIEQIQGLSLQQALSPQMQQSLGILQAPITELRQLVATELAENPALEEQTPETASDPHPGEPAGGALADEWREAYAQRAASEPWTAEALERRRHFFDSQTRPQTLHEFLLEQLHQEDIPEHLLEPARIIIGNLDDNGWFRGTLEEASYPLGLTPSDAERALEYVQALDPPGVAARDLAECLLLQLRRKGRGESLEARIVTGHLEALARRKIPEIAAALDTTPAEVQEAAAAIKSLDPRPGRAFAPDDNPVVVPDVVIERDGDDYTVTLNESEIPALRISDDAKDMIGLGTQNREVRDYLRDKIRGGRFFIRCIQQRQQTILHIAREIAARQRDFLESGPSHLRPMTMSQVAAATGVHETTVSRAVSGKYMATPQGLFEMKYFFTSSHATDTGQTLSNESVRQAIQDIVKSENPRDPLSDQALVGALAGRGIRVARRTVAKYREQLGILPSNLRREF